MNSSSVSNATMSNRRRRGALASLTALTVVGAMAFSALPRHASAQSATGQAAPTAGSVVMASTTSTEQSGLFGYLLPRLTRATGVEVKIVALGTGQALDLARRGDADLLLVHDPKAEQKFLDEKFGIERREVMYNDFVIVGPRNDPAVLAGMKSTAAALKKLASAQSTSFISRGDRSGTHGAELRLWKTAGVDLPASGPGWYQESGSGMGPTLNIASAKNAYTITDRGTWLNFRNRGDLTILVQGDPILFNQYSVILTDPKRHSHVKEALARKVADWLVSSEGQAAISGYQLGGEPLFFPNAGKF